MTSPTPPENNARELILDALDKMHDMVWQYRGDAEAKKAFQIVRMVVMDRLTQQANEKDKP